MSLQNQWSDPAYALLRFVAGLLFACHGAQKLLGALGGQKVSGAFMTTGGVVELVGGALIAVGLLTNVAAFLASGEMAVAYFKAHAPHGFWPIENKGELAVIYCFLFLFIAVAGSGRFGVDAMFHRKTR